MLQVTPEQIEWLKAVRDNMVANEGSVSLAYFLEELERLTTDGKHPFDCKCAIHG